MRVDATIRRCVFVFCCVPLEPAFQHCELVTRRTLPRGAVIISIRGSSTISVWLFLDVLLRASGNANFFGVFFCVFLFFLVFFGCVFVPFFLAPSQRQPLAAAGRRRLELDGLAQLKDAVHRKRVQRHELEHAPHLLQKKKKTKTR